MAWNLDPSDPKYGEDRNGGAIRNYEYPERSGQPMTVDDYRATPNDRFGDWGGVHTNSGIPNHAYFEVVVRVGRDKAQQILWRAMTEHLQPDSDFEDFRERDARLGRGALRQRHRGGRDRRGLRRRRSRRRLGSAEPGGVLNVMAHSLVRSVGVRERIGVLLVLAGLAAPQPAAATTPASPRGPARVSRSRSSTR